MQQNTKEKIIVINEGKLGDVIVSSPLCREIKKRFPKSYLYFVASPYSVEIAKNLPDVDEVIVFNKNTDHKGIIGLYRFLKTNKKLYKPDYTFIVHRYNRGNLLAILLNSKRRISDCTDSHLYKYFLTHKMYKNISERPLAKTSEYGNYINFDKNIIENREFELSYSISENAVEKAKKLLKSVTDIPFDNLICLSFNKLFEEKKVSKLIAALNAKEKTPVFIGTKEFAYDNNLLEGNYINLFGKTDIEELNGVISLCKMVITIDTGTMHIAAGLNKPTIAIQPKKNVEVWGYTKFHTILEEDVINNMSEKVINEYSSIVFD